MKQKELLTDELEGGADDGVGQVGGIHPQQGGGDDEEAAKQKQHIQSMGHGNTEHTLNQTCKDYPFSG